MFTKFENFTKICLQFLSNQTLWPSSHRWTHQGPRQKHKFVDATVCR